MDIDAMKIIAQSKTSDRQEEVNYVKAAASRASALEHLVPEQMYSTDTDRAQGVSAVKAIALAAAEGQRVYTITQANLSTALSQIFLEPETEQEIQNAVNAGLTVTAHEGIISYAGWNGAGYIIEDPTTGAGAYKISGGSNGASIQVQDISIIGTLTITDTLLFLIGFLGKISSIFSSSVSAYQGINALLNGECTTSIVSIIFMVSVVVFVSAFLILLTRLRLRLTSDVLPQCRGCRR